LLDVSTATSATGTAPGPAPAKDMVWVPGGTFLMGSDLPDYPEEGPPHPVSVDGFWVDETPVTVAAFRRFVKDTGYVTVAERPLDPADYPNLSPADLAAGSLVFTPTRGPVDLTDWRAWWRFVPGTSWAHPQGPDSTTGGRERHPVTHVAWEDVAAYAQWAGKALPTEAEWEFAARGGLDGAVYAWGDEPMPKGRPLANHWIGEFPWQNLEPAGRQRTTPVRSYPANGYGLYDVTGNVWEWTADFYRAQHEAPVHACCAPANPRVAEPEGSYDADEPGGAHIPRRVIKGGSHLCADNYCRRYRPAARQAQQLDSAMSHLGFRCIVRP
jgi:formylglycine-generating enzyme required for sulfatase activity